jgi:pimeloyl-ACP methyl ester carboxylesterase
MPYANDSKYIFYILTPPTLCSNRHLLLTLVFIHGLGSSSSFYAPVVSYLTAKGNHCLTVDTHGSGSSTYTGTGNSIESIASDVCALLDQINITENVVLIGRSMGGIVAPYLASSDSQRRFVAVVLNGPVNPNPGAAAVFNKRINVVE